MHSKYIIYLDDMRKFWKEQHDIWVQNRKIGEKQRDFEFARYCAAEAKDAANKADEYISRLVSIGVDTGDWEDKHLRIALDKQ